MNVRITLREAPQQTLLHGGIGPVVSDGDWLGLWNSGRSTAMWPDASYLLERVMLIELDDDPGDLF